jgi:hypothetical protein
MDWIDYVIKHVLLTLLISLFEILYLKYYEIALF